MKRVLKKKINDGLCFIILQSKNYIVVFIDIIVIVLFGFGILLSIISMFSFMPLERLLLRLLFLFIIIILTIFALYTLFWMFFGKEIITLKDGNLKVKKSLFGFGATETFKLNKISNLRVKKFSPPPFTWDYSMVQWGLSGGNISFLFEGNTHRFAIKLDEKEAEKIINDMLIYLRQREIEVKLG